MSPETTTATEVSSAEREMFSQSRLHSGLKERTRFLAVEELARNQILGDRRHAVESGE